MRRSLPIARTTTSPEFRPTRTGARPRGAAGPPPRSDDGRLHVERRVARPHGVIFVGEGRPEERHNPIAHHLVDRALVAVDGLHHPLQDGVEEPPRLLGIAVGEQLHRALQVGEEHRDLLPLAFEGGLRGEDLLGEVLGGVGVRGREPGLGLGRDTLARPHSEQNLAAVESAAPQCPQDRARGAPHSSQNLACGRFSRWHRGQCIPTSPIPDRSCRPGSSVTAPGRSPELGVPDRPGGTAARPYPEPASGASRRLPLPVGPADPVAFRLGGVATGTAAPSGRCSPGVTETLLESPVL